MKLLSYLKLLRVHHYIKNGLVFAPLLCSGQFFQKDKLLSVICGFAAFCLLSSCIYILNDIQDIEKDCLHPTKRKRPLASGEVSKRQAIIIAVITAVLAAVIHCFTSRLEAALLLLLYFLLNLGYSFGLKKIPILDISILVAGFLIRVLYGAAVSDVSISEWFYLTVISMAFFFALGKRRNELKRNGTVETRSVLKFYTENFLDKNMYLCLALTNTFYALWSMDKTTATHYRCENLVWTFPIVLLITMKYSLAVEKDSDGDPVEVLIHDKILILLCGIYVAAMFIMLYL